MSVAAVTIAIFQTLLDWLSIAIILVFLYMIFSLATNGEGLSALENIFKPRDHNTFPERTSRPEEKSPSLEKTSKKTFARPDFSPIFERLENELELYRGKLKELQEFMKDILETHIRFLRTIGGYGSPTPPISDEQWERFFEKNQELKLLSIYITNLFNDIINHESFKKIPEEQAARFVRYSQEYMDLLTQTEELFRDFKERYKRGVFSA